MNIVAVLGMPAGMVLLGPLADRVPIEWIFVVTGLVAFAFTAASFAAEPGREMLTPSARPSGGSLPADQGEAVPSGKP